MDTRIDCWDPWHLHEVQDPAPTLDSIVDAWLADETEPPDDWLANAPVAEEPLDWAFSAVSHLTALHPDLGWAFVEAAAARTGDPWQLGMLVAGPVEDILSSWPELVPDVESLASRDPDFREALRGVYQLLMTDEQYARVRAIAGNPVGAEEVAARDAARGPAEHRRREAEEWRANAAARRRGHLADVSPPEEGD